MKDKRSTHLKVQEHADCFATTNPLEEMAAIRKDSDTEDAALRWLALAVLNGVNANAEKITVVRTGEGGVTVTAKYSKTAIPSPGPEIGEKIFQAVREITHLEGEKGKTQLALGIRDSSLEIQVKVKRDGENEKLTLTFPQ